MSASRPWRSAPTPRAGPRPPTSSATSATSRPSYLAAHPNDGYTQGSQIGRVGNRGPVRALPAGRRRAPGPLGRRQRHGRRHPQHDRSADRRHRRAQHRHRPAAGGAERPASSRSWPTARRPTRSTADGSPPAPNGAAIVMNPQNGQVLAMASYPTYDLNEWVGGISSANFTALQASGAENNDAIEGQYTPGSTFKLVTATAALQDGLWSPTQYYDDTGTLQDPRLPGPRGQQRHRVRPARRPGRQRRHLRHLGRAHRVERLVLLQPGRPVLAGPSDSSATRRSRTRPPPTARGRSPGSTSPARRRGASTAT